MIKVQTPKHPSFIIISYAAEMRTPNSGGSYCRQLPILRILQLEHASGDYLTTALGHR